MKAEVFIVTDRPVYSYSFDIADVRIDALIQKVSSTVRECITVNEMLASLPTIKVTDVINVTTTLVCKQYGLRPKELYKSSRSRKIAIPRQIVFYIVKTLTDKYKTYNMNLSITYKALGFLFGKHHATVIHSIKMVDNALKSGVDILINPVIVNYVMKEVEEFIQLNLQNHETHSIKSQTV